MNFDQMGVTETTSIDSVKKLDTSSTLMESNNSNGVASLCPITPSLTKENVKTTSLSTPVEDVFDPCVLGPNQTDNPGSYVQRKLDFGCDGGGSENGLENGSLMETVYESIVEGIISKQAEDILAEILVPDASHDVLMTPPSAPRLTGLAEACPGAPLKPTQVVVKRRDVNLSLCRKLDFDSYA